MLPAEESTRLIVDDLERFGPPNGDSALQIRLPQDGADVAFLASAVRTANTVAYHSEHWEKYGRLQAAMETLIKRLAEFERDSLLFEIDGLRLLLSLERGEWPQDFDLQAAVAGLDALERWLLAPPNHEVGNVKYLGNRRCQVDSNTPIVLTETEDTVLSALIELGGAAEIDELRNHTGISDANKILRGIRLKHPELATAIILPGGRGKGGYRTTIFRGT
jgi:hypothetical protein